MHVLGYHLPGWASRMHVESQTSWFNILKALRDKLDIKSLKPSVLFFSLQVGSLIKLAIMT